MDLERSGADFETTQWTVIEAVCEPAHPQHQQAKSLLMLKYWPPVYAWFRHRGMNRVDAAEATQSFYVNVLLQRQLFERADPSRGGLRQLIRTALKRYAIDLARMTLPDRPVFMSESSLDAEDADIASQCASDPDTAFDQRWSGLALEESMDRCRRHYEMAGRMDYWEAFRTRVLQPLISGNAAPPLSHVAQLCGFTDAAHAAVVVHTVKERCKLFLKQVISESVQGSVDQEFEFMQRFLR
jgi:hypothetical protein